MTPLTALARAAGVALEWTDANEMRHVLNDGRTVAILEALGLPCRTDRQCREGVRELERLGGLPARCITVEAGQWLDARLIAGSSGTDRDAAVQLMDEDGRAHVACRDERGQLRAPDRPGYYRTALAGNDCTVAVAPPRCFGIADLAVGAHAPLWGVSAQLYGLSRHGDGGLGDSGAAQALCQRIAACGGDALGLSPLHAMAPVNGYYSPYAPSDRCFLNPLHTDADQVLGVGTVRRSLLRTKLCEPWQMLEEQPLVDWSAASVLRRQVWRGIFDELLETASPLRDAFLAFEVGAPKALQDYAHFAARQVAAAAQDVTHDGYEQRFQLFSQWLASRSWEQTAAAACAAGMRLGLIFDIAVGFQRGGSEAARHRDAVLHGLSLGAPPDAFDARGQSWGVTTYSPLGLRAKGFGPFIELLRANMRHAGAVRIDHVLGLARMWVVPDGGEADRGAYLRYPFDDLIRLIALESWRHRCVVIGEDLGTVPAGLRDALAAKGLLGIDVLLFTRNEDGSFRAPSTWRKHAMATTTTHDLPPLAGWQCGGDLQRLAKAQNWPAATVDTAAQERATAVADICAIAESPERSTSSFSDQALRWVAHSASDIAMFPLEDLLGLTGQPNVPGTTVEQPNWRRRLHPDWCGAALGRQLATVNLYRREVPADA